MASNTPLLDSVKTPADLRKIDENRLPEFAEELRQSLIDSVSSAGGHFGAGLGCVELTVALHYLYDTPYDRIIWDVGHQAYPHKMLTGRREQITSIKKKAASRHFQSVLKANTTPLALVIHQPRSARVWVWPWRPTGRVNRGALCRSSVTAP